VPCNSVVPLVTRHSTEFVVTERITAPWPPPSVRPPLAPKPHPSAAARPVDISDAVTDPQLSELSSTKLTLFAPVVTRLIAQMCQ